jgi:sporulation protein YtfJ
VGEHAIGGLIRAAMESIKTMVDVNTVVGDAFETGNGTVIVPVTRVCVGLGAGGGEYQIAPVKEKEGAGHGQPAYPFGGGTGAGISVTPVGFLVATPDGGVRMLPTHHHHQPLDRLIDLMPTLMEKLGNLGRRASDCDCGCDCAEIEVCALEDERATEPEKE